MTITEFKLLFTKSSNLNFFFLNEDMMIEIKPIQLNILSENKIIRFKNVKELIDYNDSELIPFISALKFDEINSIYNGGRGAGFEKKDRVFKFSSDSTTSEYANINSASEYASSEYAQINNLSIAQINRKLQGKNIEKSIDTIAKLIKNSKVEKSVVVDKNTGKVLKITTGSEYAVKTSPSKDTYVIHNHPKSKVKISKSDIVNFSGTKVSGIFVVDKNKKYSLIKNNKFKATQFMKAILTSELNGKDYNSAVDKWLKNNQGKYGYKYKTENV